MTDRWTCDDVRDSAFEYRRGELEADKRESVEVHLESCVACRDYVEKLFTLMSSPPPIEAPTDGYADALFGEIEARIEREEKRQQDADPRHGDVQEEFAPAAPGVRWGTAAIGLAAGFLLAVGIGWFVVSGGFLAGEANAPAETVADKTPQTDEESSRAVDDARAFSKLEPRPSRRAGVGILASTDAEWSLEGRDDLVLQIERGTLLVEYLPRDGRQFRVEAPNMRVRVVGTIFYVSAQERSSAGVIAGAVEVDREGEETIELEEGQRVRGTGAVESIPEEDVRTLRSQVDVRRHHAALRRRMEASQAEDRDEATETAPARESVADESRDEPPRRVPSQLSEALADRRAKAESAIRAGQYRKAESIYRELLGELDPAHPAAPSIHLDLAGLYLEQMNRPRQALPYLRDFLRKWPNDVAAAAVQRRLCALAGELDVDEPRCDETAPGQ